MKNSHCYKLYDDITYFPNKTLYITLLNYFKAYNLGG